MPVEAAIAERSVVSSINTKQAAAPWWHGMTLDEQDDVLNRIDPQRYGPGQKPPMTAGRWNREKKRVRRARERWIEEIAALRRPCQCENCRKNRRPPFPPYYVVRQISYECWLESQEIDREMEFLLEPLRNERRRVGAAFVRRTPTEIDGIVHTSN
jgi:hypothetical protein